MRTRKEYEDIMEETFLLAGESKAARLQMDALLDIRELLMWFRNEELFKQTVAARERITNIRISRNG